MISCSRESSGPGHTSCSIWGFGYCKTWCRWASHFHLSAEVAGGSHSYQRQLLCVSGTMNRQNCFQVIVSIQKKLDQRKNSLLCCCCFGMENISRLMTRGKYIEVSGSRWEDHSGGERATFNKTLLMGYQREPSKIRIDFSLPDIFEKILDRVCRKTIS